MLFLTFDLLNNVNFVSSVVLIIVIKISVTTTGDFTWKNKRFKTNKLYFHKNNKITC
jgi:hypothetical protein